MKRFKLSLALIVTVFLFAWMPNIKAYDPENQIKFNYKYNRSLNNTCYWISGSASGFTSSINNAAYDWAHLKNPIVMTPVSSSYATHMDFYGKPSSFWPNAGIVGETRFFTSNGSSISPNSGNWFYTDIYLNTTSSYNVQGTTAHEMGHAFGLAHWNSNPNSIMCQAKKRTVQTVQAIDNQHLNEKYR